MRINSAVWLLLVLLAGAPAGGSEEAAPSWSWRDTDGKAQSLGDYRGRIVVLNFWATWCIPCQQEMPMLAGAHKRYQERGVAVVGASVDDDKSQAQIPAFAKKYKIAFPLLVGATTDEMQKLGMGDSVPATAFFDADGRLVGRVLGELDKSELQHRIEWMLGDRRGKEPPAFVDGSKKKKPEAQIPVFPH